jgi:hypothetical protein
VNSRYQQYVQDSSNDFNGFYPKREDVEREISFLGSANAVEIHAGHVGCFEFALGFCLSTDARRATANAILPYLEVKFVATTPTNQTRCLR